ncbi:MULTISPECIES: M50 family metallopeptidase [Pelosinus]|uniref:Peptidase M50 n=1 Tax=Pelosinus fermentans B4 TaxID=1149862 RepID=I8RGU0_9FIRM|nr:MULTISPECIES: M50 family metallopeptidase [Pelosinus]EIW17030.1 peptidase M50 [Pelosinus fermentans B4]EIW23171.1 peptidase M50 [Pelosinus fermentans A11]OAM93786.1 peptidase M50 [Pelosinus fermentans DSM 17108]SDQ90025.1 stage IV sporulation protein FB [Pelosinus fermentans]
MRVANVAGIDLIVSYWFIAMILFFSLAGMMVKVLLVFSAVLWHELAHAGAAIALGFSVREVELLPFGGVARIEGLGAASSKSEMIIAAAGPAASMVLAAIVYGSMFYFNLWTEIWDFFYKANIMLAIFNMIPGLPLDGGRIFRAWLALYMDYGKATAVAAGVSKCVSISLVCIVIFQYVQGSTINISFLVAAIFLYTTAKSELKVAGFRTLRIMAQKKTLLRSRGMMPTIHLTVMKGVLLKDIVRLFRPDQYYVMLVVNDDCRVCGTLTETEVWEGLPKNGLHASIGELIDS